jgi:hypothetical protein
MPPQWYTYVLMSPGGQTVDVSLSGESLQAWEECVASLRGTEWLLGWALRLNRAAVIISLPLWLIAQLISIPLTFISIVAFGHLFLPFHWLVVRPLTSLVLWTSDLWMVAPAARPLLLLIGPPIVALGMIMISLTPDMNVDIRDSRRFLCELWPLSHRRLQWIAQRGTGRAAT